MDINNIPVVVVSYNSAELIDALLSSFRRYYPNHVFIIDGSDENLYAGIEQVSNRYQNVTFRHFDYNIHHGPGMAWAIENLGLQGQVLFLDSDIILINKGFIESLSAQLSPDMYGVGCVACVNEEGFDIEYTPGAIRYLHPPCMLCNVEVMRQWPLPIKHGAPMFAAMKAIHDAGMQHLIGHVEWIAEDYTNKDNATYYIIHESQGTVRRTGGYHLEEWLRSIMQTQQNNLQTLTEPKNYNHDLLSLMPTDARGIVEVGCNNGALANAYKRLNPSCIYNGIEIEADNAELARKYCTTVLHLDIEKVDESFYGNYSECNVWVFGDVLEHLRDPWEVLARIRRSMPTDGCVVICLPNAQHWSVQAKLSVGDFRYEDSGLLDRTHLRFFTRATMLEMFAGAGFAIEKGFPRIFGELKNEHIIAAIKSMAIGAGVDPETAYQDSLPLQYVVKLVPI